MLGMLLGGDDYGSDDYGSDNWGADAFGVTGSENLDKIASDYGFDSGEIGGLANDIYNGNIGVDTLANYYGVDIDAFANIESDPMGAICAGANMAGPAAAKVQLACGVLNGDPLETI